MRRQPPQANRALPHDQMSARPASRVLSRTGGRVWIPPRIGVREQWLHSAILRCQTKNRWSKSSLRTSTEGLLSSAVLTDGSAVIGGANGGWLVLIIQFSGVDAARLNGKKAVWPAGIICHAAGPTADGWCVVGVWSSQAQFDRFLSKRLKPVFDRAGGMPEPHVTTFQIGDFRDHRLNLDASSNSWSARDQRARRQCLRNPALSSRPMGLDRRHRS
jgi:hypothetical protein